jgi:hypothetical protein
MKNTSPIAKARSFGLSVGTVLLIVALVLAWRGRIGRAEILGGIGAVLLALPSAAWWAFARALGYVNSRVLLSLAFFLVLTPLGVVWRLTGRDPLMRRRSNFPGWTAYPARYRNGKHFERMY